MPKRDRQIAILTEASEGGVLRHIIDLYKGLLQCDGVSPHILISLRSEEAGKALQKTDVPFEIVNTASVKSVKSALEKMHADVCHIHSFKAEFAGVTAAKQLGIPTIYTPHAFPTMREFDPLKFAYKHVEKRFSKYHSFVICVSENERDEAKKIGISDEKLTVVHNGIAPFKNPLTRALAREKYGIPQEQYVVANRCRLKRQKNIKLFAKTAEILPDILFLLWGDGEKKLLKNAPKNLRYMGSYTDVEEVIMIPNLYLSTALYEAMPYSVLENMMAKIPMILTDIPGHRCLVGKDSEILVPNNAEKIAKKIRNRREMSSEFSDLLVENAYDFVKNTSVSAMVEKIFKLYGGCL